MYKNLEKNGYNVRDIFNENKWNIKRCNDACDWIFTRVFYFEDFSIDPELFEQCKLFLAFDNFSRYKDKVYFRTFAHPLNTKILSILSDKIDGKDKPKKFHILSGHDDNVATFLMNLNYDNNECLVKEFDRKFNDGKNTELFDNISCFDRLLFTTNIILELVKN